MTTSTSNKTSSKTMVRQRSAKPWIVAGVVGVVIAAIVGSGTFYFFHNFAQDAARPIDVALVAGGAVRVCGSGDGDAGRGPDNYAPYYTILYKFNGSKNSTVKLVKEAAMTNGYSLAYQASPYGNISWYKDQVGKPSTYPGFGNGNVTVDFSIYSEGTKKLYCNLEPLQLDANHTAISLEVRLPSSK